MLKEITADVLVLLTLVSDISILLFIGLRLMNVKGVFSEIQDYFREHGLLFAWIVAMTATLGSLFYSEIMGYVPCKLCWFQRIIVYPQSIILGIAYFKKDVGVRKYIIPLSILGAIISTYQYVIQRLSVQAFCTAESCSNTFVFSYGYITIPVMALTALVMIIMLMANTNLYK